MARSQRERILVAMITSVAERGYNTTTVADIVAIAAVSRSSFYAQFTDKEACFIAAHRYALDYLIGRMTSAAAALPSRTWKERLRSDLSTYLNVLADEPSLAVTLHVEALAAGPKALDHRAEMLGLLASQTANARELARSHDASLPELPPAAFALYVGGLDELIRDRLRTATAESLRALVGPVLEAAYALFGS